jgi:hypothetical protein
MGDHRADIKIKFSMYGEEKKADMWINWSPEDSGVDQRVIDFFEQAAREMYNKGYLPLLVKEVEEDPERAEYERLKAKFEGTS